MPQDDKKGEDDDDDDEILVQLLISENEMKKCKAVDVIALQNKQQHHIIGEHP